MEKHIAGNRGDAERREVEQGPGASEHVHLFVLRPTLSGVSCSLIICLSEKRQRLCTTSYVFWPLQPGQMLGSGRRNRNRKKTKKKEKRKKGKSAERRMRRADKMSTKQIALHYEIVSRVIRDILMIVAQQFRLDTTVFRFL